MKDLTNGYVAKDSFPAIEEAFGDDVQLWKGSFYNKTEEEKKKKDQELQEMGLFV